MSQLGNLSQCIVGSDSGEVRRARRLRGRALIASILLEAAVVGAMLLWPLMAPTVLTSQPVLAPVPILHLPPHTEPTPPQQPEARASGRPVVGIAILQQPPQIPSRVVANEVDVPTVLIADWALTDAPGTGIVRDGTGITSIARPPEPARPVVLSGGVMEARLIHRVEPEYPWTARMIHLSGTVPLRAIIGTDGSVRNIEVLSGNPILAKAAVRAVHQWRYQPTLLSGQPVEVETLITVQFQTASD